jgi:hypothetical protein
VLLAIRRWFVPGQCASACAFVCGNFASVEEAARQLIDDRLAELAHNDTPVPRRRRKGDYPPLFRIHVISISGKSNSCYVGPSSSFGLRMLSMPLRFDAT